MHRKILSLFLTTLLAAGSLAGCGSSASSIENSANPVSPYFSICQLSL